LLLALLIAPTLAHAPAAQESEADVEIVRRVPGDGTRETQADWGPRRRTPQEAATAGEPTSTLSGQLALGSTASVSGPTPDFNVAADSELRFLQTLGAHSALQLGGDAERIVELDGERELYGGSISLSTAVLDVSVAGKYERNLETADDSTQESRTASGEVGVTFGVLEALPISLDASYDYAAESEDGTEVDHGEELRGELAAQGTLGSLLVDASASAGRDVDDVKDMRVVNGGGRVDVRVPLGGGIAIGPSVGSEYVRTRYDAVGATGTSVSVDASLGLYAQLGDATTLRFLPGMLSEWNEQDGPVPEGEDVMPHALAARALVGADYRSDTGGAVRSEYEVTLPLGGGVTNRAAASASWSPAPDRAGLVTNASAALTGVLAYDEAGAPGAHEATWNAQGAFGPAEGLEVSTRYGGSISGGASPEATHSVGAELRHEPWPFLTYRIAPGLDAYVPTGAFADLEQSYSGRVALRPLIGDNRLVVSAADTFTITAVPGSPDSSSGDAASTEYQSALSSGVMLPVGSMLQTGYAFEWVWYRPGQVTRNTYTHSVDLTANLGPFGLTSGYQFRHGYEPSRHDLTSGITIRFGGGYALRARMQWSRRRNDGLWVQPFSGTVLFSRRFGSEADGGPDAE
jgi:hypothetical protein